MLREKNNKYNEEKDKNAKNFYHEPSIAGDRLEILQYLCMRPLNIQLGILHIGINSVKEKKRTF